MLQDCFSEISSHECLSGPSKNCFICGNDNPAGLKVCFRKFEPGVVIAEFIPPDHLNGFKGVLHGGVISAVLDDAMDWAIYSGTNKWYVTTQMTVNFKKTVPVDKPLRLKGWVVKEDGSFFSGTENGKIKRVQFARAELIDLGGDILASSEGKFFQIPDEKANGLM